MMTMQIIDSFSLAGFVSWLAWVLLHAVWQGLLIAVLLWIALKFIGATASSVRYRLACAAMLVMAVSPVATGFVLRDQLLIARRITSARLELPAAADLETDAARLVDREYTAAIRTRMPNAALPRTETEPSRVDDPRPPLSVRASVVAALHIGRDVINRNAGYLVAAWFLGVAVCASRLLSSLRAVRILRRSGTSIADARLLQSFTRLIGRLNLDPGIRLMQSASVNVPTVLCWLRPVVLLPMSCSTGLSPQQIEALLAHELAHIKRHDYLINLLQCFVETVLYYHPAVWWISGIIRVEREHCCDAIAIALLSDRDVYASALIDLARMSSGSSQLAMSAKGGILKDRISRILNNQSTKSTTSGPVVALTMAFLLTLLVTAVFISKAGADDPKADRPAPTQVATDNGESKAKEADAKKADQPSNDAISKPETAPRQGPQIRRGTGNGGAEIFEFAQREAVHNELGMSPEAIATINTIHQQFRATIQETLPPQGVRTRSIIQEPKAKVGVITLQEPTPAGMAAFKAATAKFRPQLKEVLTPEQYTRLQQITWQAMGTAALSDDELIDKLALTNEQLFRITGIRVECASKRIELTGGANISSPPQMNRRRELIAERDTKINDSLPTELRDRYAALLGKKFEFPQNQFGFGRHLLILIRENAVQKDIGVSDETSAKMKNISNAFEATRDNSLAEQQKLREMTPEDRKTARERIVKSETVIRDKLLAELKELLTADQWTRLKQIHWQELGTEALTNPELVEALSIPQEVQEKVKAIRTEYQEKQQEIGKSQADLQQKIRESYREEDAKIIDSLTQAQRDKFALLKGKDFDDSQLLGPFGLPERGGRVQRTGENPGAAQPPNDAQGGAGGQGGGRLRGRQGRGAYRGIVPLAAYRAVQAELNLSVDDAVKIRGINDQFGAAVLEIIGDSKVAEMSKEELTKQLEQIQTLEKTFIPPVKELMTAEQFERLQQIHWQDLGTTALFDSEVIEALSISKEQLDKITEIRAEIFARQTELLASAGDRGRSFALAQKLQELNKERDTKLVDALTKDQRDKFASLKGKEFDVRLIRPTGPNY